MISFQTMYLYLKSGEGRKSIKVKNVWKCKCKERLLTEKSKQIITFIQAPCANDCSFLPSINFNKHLSMSKYRIVTWRIRGHAWVCYQTINFSWLIRYIQFSSFSSLKNSKGLNNVVDRVHCWRHVQLSGTISKKIILLLPHEIFLQFWYLPLTHYN